MSQRWIVLALVLLAAIPSALHARGMKDKVYLQTEEVGKVEFGHFVHMEAVGRDCPSCHNEIYHILPNKNPAFTMKEMEAGKACGACHNGKKAFSVKGDCATCHGNGDVAMESAVGAVPFSHKIHTAAFECASCHPTVFKAEKGTNKATMKQMEKGASCGACHDGSTAFTVKENCGKCHISPEISFETDAGKANFSHKFHTEAFGCDACHPGTFKANKGANTASMAEMEKGKSCGACHDGSTAFGVKDDKDCGKCHEM